MSPAAVELKRVSFLQIAHKGLLRILIYSITCRHNSKGHIFQDERVGLYLMAIETIWAMSRRWRESTHGVRTKHTIGHRVSICALRHKNYRSGSGRIARLGRCKQVAVNFISAKA